MDACKGRYLLDRKPGGIVLNIYIHDTTIVGKHSHKAKSLLGNRGQMRSSDVWGGGEHLDGRLCQGVFIVYINDIEILFVSPHPFKSPLEPGMGPQPWMLAKGDIFWTGNLMLWSHWHYYNISVW